MADTQPAIFPFINSGLNIQTEPSALKAGEYAELKNLVSTQEGSISTRPGRQVLNHITAFDSASVSLIHSIGKLTIGTDDTKNPRYVGALGQVFRTYMSGFGGLNVTGAPWLY